MAAFRYRNVSARQRRSRSPCARPRGARRLRAVEIPRQSFRDQRGRLLFEVDVAELWRPVGPCLAIHRADLHELLLEAAGDVPIHLGMTVNRVTDQDRVVSVELSDGTSGDYDLVVAADGIEAPSASSRSAHRAAPARRPDRLAFPRAPAPRAHDLVGDAGAPHGIPDRSDRRRPRLLLLRRGLTPRSRQRRVRPGRTAQAAVREFAEPAATLLRSTPQPASTSRQSRRSRLTPGRASTSC